MTDQKEDGFSKIRRWWMIFSTIIRNIIYIVVVLLAFQKAHSDFENVALCILILIYQSITWTHTAQIRLAVEEAFVNRRMLFTLQKAAGEDVSDGIEIVKTAETNYGKGILIYYMNMVGAVVVYFIVMWKLLVTLVF